MDNKARVTNLKEKDYQRLLGVKKATFDKMIAILKKAYKQEHLMGGHPPKLSVLDKLIIMLGYYREYRPMENIAFDYGVAKSTICESIKWVEYTLIKSGEFSLPSKRKLMGNTQIEVIIVDATECEIERPQKNKDAITPVRKRSTH
jgi:predicted DNA-binding protein YlxM (UPF0122 family)